MTVEQQAYFESHFFMQDKLYKNTTTIYEAKNFNYLREIYIIQNAV